MKRMIYKETSDYKAEILHEGTYRKFHFVIVSYGTHPCAYVEIPKNHPWYKKDRDDCYLYVHGGLTYSGDLMHVDRKLKGFYLGWDYAHAGDFHGTDISFMKRFGMPTEDKKKWTTGKILAQVKKAINELRKVR